MLVIRRKREWNNGKNCGGEKANWGSNWILSGDFNDIRKPQEKIGGRVSTKESCQGFKEFILKMNIEEVEFQGR